MNNYIIFLLLSAIYISFLGCTMPTKMSEPGPQGISGNTEVLLEITNRNAYMDSEHANAWGDASNYRRYLLHYNVSGLLTYGGVDFENDRAYLTVNDGFMDGLDNFIISFWFITVEDNPSKLDRTGNGGVLVCSNWATHNNGDWLIGFSDEGRLVMNLQKPGGVLILKSKIDYFHKGRKYYVQFIKTNRKILLYLENELHDSADFTHPWPENGVPLAIGGNPFDRDGMGFFNGIIGGFKIETLLNRSLPVHGITGIKEPRHP